MTQRLYCVDVDGNIARQLSSRDMFYAVVGRPDRKLLEIAEIELIRLGGPEQHARYTCILSGTIRPESMEEQFAARKYGSIPYADFEGAKIAELKLELDRRAAAGDFDKREVIAWHAYERPLKTSYKKAALTHSDIEVLDVHIDKSMSVAEYKEIQRQLADNQRQAFLSHPGLDDTFSSLFCEAMDSAVRLQKSVNNERRALIKSICTYLAVAANGQMDAPERALTEIAGYEGFHAKYVHELLQRVLLLVQSDAEELGAVKATRAEMDAALARNQDDSQWNSVSIRKQLS